MMERVEKKIEESMSISTENIEDLKKINLLAPDPSIVAI